ncbi:MAG: hypothetical protein AB1760_16600 [Pseudomonadota bacterium]
MTASHAKIAVYWDESFLWGLIAYRTFTALGIDLDLLSARDIREGGLDGGAYDVLFVPGGWASDKYAALGDEGAAAVRRFVEGGGGYLGFCGGAGLALSHDSGLGLAPFGRMPTSERLPSFSGRVALSADDSQHPMWKGLAGDEFYHAWWPGQFSLGGSAEDQHVRILARYGEPGAGAFVTDLPVVEGFDWSAWEKLYGINLDPSRLAGEPAVVEVSVGSGRCVLSYLHFETPCDEAGQRVLMNLVGYLAGKPAVAARAADGAMLCEVCEGTPEAADGSQAVCMEDGSMKVEVRVAPGGLPSDAGSAADLAGEMERTAREFVAFGSRNFLWYWRSAWLLQWRRGVRGIEYSTLFGMISELARLCRSGVEPDPGQLQKLEDLRGWTASFFREAIELLKLERYAMARGPISPLRSDDPQIARLRETLFSTERRCGGLYRDIIVALDGLLAPMLRRELAARE